MLPSCAAGRTRHEELRSSGDELMQRAWQRHLRRQEALSLLESHFDSKVDTSFGSRSETIEPVEEGNTDNESDSLHRLFGTQTISNICESL